MADIKTLKHRYEFGFWLKENGFSGTGVEIGVQYGENAKNILRSYEGRLILVDPYINWKNGEYIDGCNEFDMNIARDFSLRYLEEYESRTAWMYDTSQNAIRQIPHELDFVYLDGVHHNPVLRQDIEGYWEHVKEGGVLGGHDFMNVRQPNWVCEVESEVRMFAMINKLDIHITPCTSWWIVKK